MSKIIYLATTEGCEACNIMERILRKVHEDNLYTFSIDIMDYHNLPLWIDLNVSLTDFPTLIFIENDTIKHHTSGTMTAKELQNIIEDINFN